MNKCLNMSFGIPKHNQYQNILDGKLFKKMEEFSDKFISSNNSFLKAYARKWVNDPLHQWNRQWEYPFVFVSIMQFIKKAHLDKINILDAGSGVTFFPYYLQSILSKIKLTCVDKDAGLHSIISKINKANKIKVKLNTQNLSQLSFPDQSVDIIYCISVLEHLNNRKEVLEEFYRILKYKGLLIITFDLSLDGKEEIPLEEASKLLHEISEKFNVCCILPPIPLRLGGLEPGFVDTKYFQDKNPQLLPWKYPLLSIIKRFITKRPTFSLPNLTVYCAAISKF